MDEILEPTTPEQKRTVAALFSASGLFSASTIAVFTLTAIIAADLSGSDTVAGLPNTLGLLGRAAFAVPFGYLMDRIGRRLSLSLGYSLAIAGSLFSVWAISTSSLAGFLIGALAIGMSRAAGDQSRYVGAEVFHSQRRAKVIGIIVSAGTVGAIFGPLLVPASTVWMANIGLPQQAGPFIISAVAMTLATLIIFVFLRPDPQQLGFKIAEQEALVDPQNIENIAGDGRTLREIFSAPMVQLAIAAMVLSYFVMAMLMVITPLHMDRHDHTTAAISGVIMAHTLGMFGTAWLTGILVDRFGRVQMIVAGTAVLAISCIVAPLSLKLPILGLALFLLGLGWNFCFVSGSTLLSDALASHERGRAQGASEMLVALGTGAASLATGFLFAQGQFLLVSMVGFLGTFLLFASTVILLRRDYRQATVSAAD
jgi:MFS family permease